MTKTSGTIYKDVYLIESDSEHHSIGKFVRVSVGEDGTPPAVVIFGGGIYLNNLVHGLRTLSYTKLLPQDVHEID